MLSTAVQLSLSNSPGFLRKPRTAIVGAANGGCRVQGVVGGRRVGSRGSGVLFIFMSSRVLLLLLLT